MPAALAVGLGRLPVAGCVKAGFARAVDGGTDGTAAFGLAHAPPYAAVGSTCGLFSAATD